MSAAAANPEAAASPESPWEADDVAAYIVDAIVDIGGNVLYEKYSNCKAVDLLSNDLVGMVYENLALLFNDPDSVDKEGDSGTAPPPFPVASALDSWTARKIPMKKRADPRQTETKKERKSIMEQASPRSVSSGQRTAAQKRKPPEPKDSHAIVQIIEVPTTPRTPQYDKSNAAESELKEESWFEKQLREEAEAERLEQEKKERRMREQQEEKDRYDQLCREMKGKDYQVDIDGSIVVVDTKLHERLPRTTEVAIVITSKATPPGGGGAGSSGGGSGVGSGAGSPGEAGRDVLAEKARKGGGKGNKSPQSPSKRNNREAFPIEPGEHFQPPPSYQPPLDSTIALSPGVEVRYGESSRKGPEPLEDQKHMSKKEFLLHQKLLETNALGVATTVSEQSPAAIAILGVKKGSESDLASLRPDAGGAPATSSSSPALPEVSASPHSPSHATSSQPTTEGDYNLDLVRSPDWGRQHSSGKAWSPPRVPSRHSTKAEDPVGSPSGGHHHLRDRPFIHTGEKKHLPPPPVGATTGHGIPIVDNSGKRPPSPMAVAIAMLSSSPNKDEQAAATSFLPAIRSPSKPNSTSTKKATGFPSMGADNNEDGDSSEKRLPIPSKSSSPQRVMTYKDMKKGGTVSITKAEVASRLTR